MKIFLVVIVALTLGTFLGVIAHDYLHWNVLESLLVVGALYILCKAGYPSKKPV